MDRAQESSTFKISYLMKADRFFHPPFSKENIKPSSSIFRVHTKAVVLKYSFAWVAKGLNLIEVCTEENM